MKKIISLVAALMMVVSISASNMSVSNGNITIQRVTPFDQVIVNVPSRVRVVQGDDYEVLINGIAADDSASLNCQVRNGVLYINTMNSYGFSDTGCPMVITVVTPMTDTVLKMGNDVQVLRRKR